MPTDQNISTNHSWSYPLQETTKTCYTHYTRSCPMQGTTKTWYIHYSWSCPLLLVGPYAKYKNKYGTLTTPGRAPTLGAIYNELSLPSHALIHLISNSYQQPTYWAPPSFYPNLETYAPTYLCTLSHDGIIIMPGYHRVGFPGKSCYGTAQNQEILYSKNKSIIAIP